MFIDHSASSQSPNELIAWFRETSFNENYDEAAITRYRGHLQTAGEDEISKDNFLKLGTKIRGINNMSNTKTTLYKSPIVNRLMHVSRVSSYESTVLVDKNAFGLLNALMTSAGLPSVPTDPITSNKDVIGTLFTHLSTLGAEQLMLLIGVIEEHFNALNDDIKLMRFSSTGFIHILLIANAEFGAKRALHALQAGWDQVEPLSVFRNRKNPNRPAGGHIAFAIRYCSPKCWAVMVQFALFNYIGIAPLASSGTEIRGSAKDDCRLLSKNETWVSGWNHTPEEFWEAIHYKGEVSTAKPEYDVSRRGSLTRSLWTKMVRCAVTWCSANLASDVRLRYLRARYLLFGVARLDIEAPYRISNPSVILDAQGTVSLKKFPLLHNGAYASMINYCQHPIVQAFLRAQAYKGIMLLSIAVDRIGDFRTHKSSPEVLVDALTSGLGIIPNPSSYFNDVTLVMQNVTPTAIEVIDKCFQLQTTPVIDDDVLFIISDDLTKFATSGVPVLTKQQAHRVLDCFEEQLAVSDGDNESFCDSDDESQASQEEEDRESQEAESNLKETGPTASESGAGDVMSSSESTELRASGSI